jgi:hypothetical protein
VALIGLLFFGPRTLFGQPAWSYNFGVGIGIGVDKQRTDSDSDSDPDIRKLAWRAISMRLGARLAHEVLLRK